VSLKFVTYFYFRLFNLFIGDGCLINGQVLFVCVYLSSDMRGNIHKRLVSSTVDEMAIKSVIGAGVVPCVWRRHRYVAKEAVLIVQFGKR